MTIEAETRGASSGAASGSARLEAMKAQERVAGRIWCSLCKTYGSHYSSECPTPLGMVAPNGQSSPTAADGNGGARTNDEITQD